MSARNTTIQARIPSLWGSLGSLTTWHLGATLFAATTAAAIATFARFSSAFFTSISSRSLSDAASRNNRDEAIKGDRDLGEEDAAELEDLADGAPDPGRESWLQEDIRRLPRIRKNVEGENNNEILTVGNGEILPGRQRLFVKTYGCAHNSSDSEFMMGLLRDYGYALTDEFETADACIINSCTVKNPSQDTAVNLVNKAKEAGKSVVLAGCVPSADGALCESLEGVSMLSVNQLDRVVEVVEESLRGHVVRLLSKKGPLPSLDLPKVRKNKFIEIIPISGGCLGNCSYCKTKHARGKLSSYSIDAIVSRAFQAASEGVSEVWLASEDTGAYGIDLGTNIVTLLEKVADALPPTVMLKLGMTNPPYMLAHVEGVAEVLKRPNVFEFLHVPVQSGSDQVLRAMVREYSVAEFKRLVDGLRAAVPEVLVATDIICGFPAEAEEDHKDSLALVDEFRFPVLNISQFYPRPGTPAAKLRKLSSDVVKRRSSEMTAAFESYTTYDHLVGREERVWFSDSNAKHRQTIGHTKGYVKVVVDHQESLLGHSALVKLKSCTKWHIEGEVIGGFL
mmetsp:Transcript_84719/g.133808  ORF Transcript_84719/g.133808 Transcript_84719/m.133808 type:complete len:565 (-) Transcript_84719:25-1719(-)|eukprot:CAMPEP_0169102882 /NCGR_PEP_ID=MMETSP1015-20121227/22407_1 /TAXON_ID=342587 /ORGANISM="Karlodinium micrum, Strain CCMP2283" /LENGTH=564 /DNA_ID=CAMNT_0009164019 /DNA_START=76 /DNA_END=1770 /DNA_ORIENTATION=-